MKDQESIRFTIASEPWEFEAIHRLNYAAFVEEIPQHAPNADRCLVDRFHDENTYAICVQGERLIGMIAARAKRPFSLDDKIPNLDSYLPSERRIVELRLLSVVEEWRNGTTFCSLMSFLWRYCRDQDYDLGIMSGTTRQLKLYKHLGFIPFGPLVGPPHAQFQPMYLTCASFAASKLFARFGPRRGADAPSDTMPAFPATSNFLPGPVDVHADVAAAFAAAPVSHRSPEFAANLKAAKQQLCMHVNARAAEIILGSGTLANDIVAGQLSLLNARGLVLTNGEFGDRLIDHARRFKLQFDVLRAGWGEAFDEPTLRQALRRGTTAHWLWAVHCETSTGVINDLAALKGIAREHGLKLCMDCVSSIGTLPVNLDDVYLASCVSGKALAAMPGLAIVGYDHALSDAPGALPRYLDLGYYAQQAGIPFTHSSNLVNALRAALERTDWPRKFERTAAAAAWLRRELRQLGLQLNCRDEIASPAVISIALPGRIRSHDLGVKLACAGYRVSYESAYLLKHNWIQICLMGEWAHDRLEALPRALARALRSNVPHSERIPHLSPVPLPK